MGSMQCNVKLGFQLSICSRMKENHEKTWSSWSVAGPSRNRRSTFFYITYINSVRTSQEAQYISVLWQGTQTTRPQRRSTFFYITYINSVRTSQETQYISVL
jgi:hypothetical protein